MDKDILYIRMQTRRTHFDEHNQICFMDKKDYSAG